MEQHFNISDFYSPGQWSAQAHEQLRDVWQVNTADLIQIEFAI
jgi:hypothetical protein